MTVTPYGDADKEAWNHFVRNSKNGTFLFIREYMEYHRDRFEDASVMIWDDRDRLLAVLPCTRVGDRIETHSGLTYGGFVTDTRMTCPIMLRVIDQVLAHFREHHVSQLVYKAVPHIYHRYPAEEDLYGLFRCGATLYRRDVTTTVRPAQLLPMQDRRVRGVKKAQARSVRCQQSNDLDAFWDVLEVNLWERHHKQPVHTRQEISLLHERFPEEISLHAAFEGHELLAGVIVYDTPMVAHAQYIAGSAKARERGALDALFTHLLTEVFRHKCWFDFGVSTESEGTIVNEGLLGFKEGFGGRTILYDTYRVVSKERE